MNNKRIYLCNRKARIMNKFIKQNPQKFRKLKLKLKIVLKHQMWQKNKNKRKILKISNNKKLKKKGL